MFPNRKRESKRLVLTKKLDLRFYYVPVSDVVLSSPVSYNKSLKATDMIVSLYKSATAVIPHRMARVRMEADCLWPPYWEQWIRGTTATSTVWELPSPNWLER